MPSSVPIIIKDIHTRAHTRICTRTHARKLAHTHTHTLQKSVYLLLIPLKLPENFPTNSGCGQQICVCLEVRDLILSAVHSFSVLKICQGRCYVLNFRRCEFQIDQNYLFFVKQLCEYIFVKLSEMNAICDLDRNSVVVFSCLRSTCFSLDRLLIKQVCYFSF